MQDNAGLTDQELFSHPAGYIETAPSQSAVARVGALAGLTAPSDLAASISIMPTTVSMTV